MAHSLILRLKDTTDMRVSKVHFLLPGSIWLIAAEFFLMPRDSLLFGYITKYFGVQFAARLVVFTV